MDDIISAASNVDAPAPSGILSDGARNPSDNLEEIVEELKQWKERGVAIDELREKVLLVEATQNGAPPTKVLGEHVEDVAVTEHNTDAESAQEAVDAATVTNFADTSTSAIILSEVLGGAEGELERWKERGVRKESIVGMKSSQLAACFSAFLVNYELDRGDAFSHMKDELAQLFADNLISGDLFAISDDEDAKELLKTLMDVLASQRHHNDSAIHRAVEETDDNPTPLHRPSHG